MKSYTSRLLQTFIGLSLLLTASFSANASLIKQEILDDFTGEVIGSVTFDMDDSFWNTGIKSSFFDGGFELVEFELSGLYSWGDVLDTYYFEVELDTSDIFAGIQFLSLDADDVGFGVFTWSYQLFYDSNFGLGILDVFQNSNGAFIDALNVRLGQVEVPAPATIGLLAMGICAIAIRRRRIR
ncbi:PEP-CTERM sorting domain-containing protein [Alteromonas sp. H39]|uniref:PEP-CTERM sorting domain-containing protein n=1 Tax=Alteromonas sp. H39 TaxID=3389876 RepID=UPI0039E1A8EE